jgi:hypothetical protein
MSIPSMTIDTSCAISFLASFAATDLHHEVA